MREPAVSSRPEEATRENPVAEQHHKQDLALAALPTQVINVPKIASEFRKIVNLSEQTELSSQAAFEAKDKRIRGYVAQETSDIPHNRFHGEEVNLNYQDSEIRAQQTDQSVSTRFWRQYMRQRLSWAGVKKGTEFLDAIERNIPIHKKNDLRPEAIANLVKALDPQDEAESLRKFDLAITRMRQFYILPRSSDFKFNQNELTEFMTVLGNLPEDTFQRIYHQFDGRTQVIYHGDNVCSGRGRTGNNGLLQIIKQGGLTLGQQEILDKAVIWDIFAECHPFTKGGQIIDGPYEFWLDYSDLLNPAIGQRLERYYPYLVDWAADSVLPELLEREAGRPPRRGEKQTCGGRDFTVGVQQLDTSGKLIYLDSLIKADWDCRAIYKMMEGVGYDKDTAKQHAEMNKALSRVLAFQSDPGSVAWARAFNEYYYGTNTLYTTGISYYEEMVKNKDTLITIAQILNSIPKQDGFNPGKFLKWKDGRPGIESYELNAYLENIAQQAGMAEIDKRYTKGLSNLILIHKRKYRNQPLTENIFGEELSLYQYLALHKDRITEQMFDQYGGPKIDAALIQEVIDQKIPIDPALMEMFIRTCPNKMSLPVAVRMNHFEELSQQDKVQTLISLPQDYLTTFPQEFQSAIAFYRSLPSGLQGRLLVWAGKDALTNVSQYIKDGKLTPFCLGCALNTGTFEEIRSFATDEVLLSFSPEERQSWQTILSYPPQITCLMQNTRVGWGDFFTEGRPTTVFLRTIARKGRQGQIDELLALVDLSAFPQEERLFWEYYKNIRKNPNIRDYLLTASDKFSDLVVNGQPTPSFLESAANAVSISTIRELLTCIKVADLSDEQRNFWEFYQVVDEWDAYSVRAYLLQHRSQFSELITNGQPTLAFLNRAAEEYLKEGGDAHLLDQVADWIDLDQLPPEEKDFWEYYKSTSFSPFILKNRARFKQMVVNKQETPLFYQTLASQEPQTMLEIQKCFPGLSIKQYQDIWRAAIGKETIDNFLAALPKSTDEARNAFTDNKYDRTTDFIRYLKERMPADQFGLNTAEFTILTAYVREFGLAKNETIYKYYRWLSLVEHRQVGNLPEEMKNLGVTSTVEMVQKIAEVRRMVFGEQQLTNIEQLRSLSPFQIQLLANVTGFDKARFGSGGTDDLSGKIDRFARALENGTIPLLPSGYSTENVEASGVKVEFNAEAVRRDYDILRKEILECIDNPPSFDHLKLLVKSVIDRRADKINQTLGKVTIQEAVAAMKRNLESCQSYLTQLDQTKDADTLVLALLGMNFSNEDRSGGEDFAGIDSVTRRIILAKLYQRDNRSPGFLENVRIKLSKDEVTAEGIDEIILTVDEMIKNHVLSVDPGHREKYWRPDILETITKNDSLRKNFRRMVERFNPHTEKLRQEQARFIKTQTGKVAEVKIIPDRGFVGEMAGYLADVCYTRVTDLMKTYSGSDSKFPLVVPYKFITGLEAGDPRFIGSVLVFEVQTTKGEPALLVRALDIPNEGEIDISKFTENLLDRFSEVARRTGKKKVLVAGTAGTISNYSSITSHIINNYVKGKESEPVSPEFNFNGYDITNQIYTARVVA